MASEPNIQQYVEAAVSQTVEQLKTALSEPISTALQSISTSLDQHRTEAKRIDTYLEERAKAHSQAIDASVSLIEDRIARSVAGINESIDARIAAYHSAAESARNAAADAAKTAEQAIAAAEQVKLRTAEADRAEAAARERIAEAEGAEERARRAVALATRRADLMVEQAVEERRAKLRRKELLAELDRNEADLADRFDAENEFIDREMDEHYASIRERLEAALTGEGDEETGETEDAGQSDTNGGDE